MNPGRLPHESRVACLILRWIVPAIVILIAVAVSADPVGSEPATSTGVKVTVSVPFVRESIDEIRARAPLRTRAVPGDRAIPFHRIPRRSDATEPARLPLTVQDLATPFFTSSPAPLAPVLDINFEGLGNPPHGQDVIPPDTMGAVGPDHLVSLLNSDFGVFQKTTGAVLQKTSLQSFWGSLGTGAGEPADFPFDPKILYDQHSERFVAITLGGSSAPDSWIMVAVSSSSDPTGAWRKWAIDADKDNDVQLSNNSADYPGLGVDAFNVYITANMYDGANVGQYSKLWVIPKAQLLAVLPPTKITWFEFPNPPGSDFTMQPAHTFGTPGSEYFLFEGSTNHLAVGWMDNISGTPVWHSPVQVAVTSYTSTDKLPGAPQSGNDNTIDTSDTRLLNVVYRNGSVWATHHVVGPSGKVEVAWYRINPGPGTLVSEGRVNDPNRWFYYPSIAVNKDNVAAIGFSGSSRDEYVGGYYTIIQPTTGTAENVALLKAGDAPYYKTGQTFGNTGGGTDNRWGDFSATVVDPTDDTSFWTLQEYAKLPVAGISQWGTWWGKFTPGNPQAPPLPPLTPPPSGGGGGGGCLSIARSGSELSFGTSLLSVGILLLPAFALGLRRFSRRQKRAVPIRHPIC